MTRFFPIEHGVGYGSVRVSVLFRPVRASLPRNLLGFDSGTLHIRKVEFDGNDEHVAELKKCKLSLSTPSDSDTLSKKDANDSQDGVEWAEESVELVVRERYSKSLSVVFKSTGMRSEKKAMAVLWMQDVVDNEDKVVEVPLWKTDDFDRLKQNYVPLNGNLDMWESGKEKMERIGTLRLDLTFSPGIKDGHGKGTDTHDSATKRVRDEVDRREAGGLGDKVGEHAGEDGVAVQGENTEVDQENAEVQQTEESENSSGSSSEESDGGDVSEGKGILKKLRKKKRHATELHRAHKGVMQVKPARTAEWLKDNVEEAGHKIKDRFTMHAREPDVETEI